MRVNMTTLAEQSFFEGLPARYLQLFVDNAMEAEFSASELIFKEGDPANRFYLIGRGMVALESQIDKTNEPFLVETIGGYSVLGWSWLFPPYTWHLDARAVTPVKAIYFDGAYLRGQCESDHDLGYELTKRAGAMVIERLQATRRRLGEENKKLPLAA